MGRMSRARNRTRDAGIVNPLAHVRALGRIRILEACCRAGAEQRDPGAQGQGGARGGNPGLDGRCFSGGNMRSGGGHVGRPALFAQLLPSEQTQVSASTDWRPWHEQASRDRPHPAARETPVPPTPALAAFVRVGTGAGPCIPARASAPRSRRLGSAGRLAPSACAAVRLYSVLSSHARTSPIGL